VAKDANGWAGKLRTSAAGAREEGKEEAIKAGGGVCQTPKTQKVA